MEKFKSGRGLLGARHHQRRSGGTFNTAAAGAAGAAGVRRATRGGGRVGGVIRGGVGRGRARGRGFSVAAAAAAAAAAAYPAWPSNNSARARFPPHRHRIQQHQQQEQPQQQYQQQAQPYHPQQQLMQQRQRQRQQRSQQLIRKVWQMRRGRHSGTGAGGSSSQQQQQQLQSSDPLNLRWVAAESQRRQLAGLSPMPGDSALGSPVLPAEGEGEEESGGDVESADAHSSASASTISAAAVVAAAAAVVVSAPSASSLSSTTVTAPAASLTVGPQKQQQQQRFKRPAGASFGGGGSGGRAFFQPIYGNYRAYYGKRLRAGNLNIGRLQDDRLELLQPDWYLGRDVLDIGCNDGILSLKIAETLGVKSLTGIDIDGHLVQRAQRNLRLRVREAEAEMRLKLSLAREGYQVQPLPERTGFPYNVFFQTGNYVLDSEEQLAKVEENKYDIIQAFSITKWIHLNWGDRGLKLFFRRAFRELRPDGKLIIEPQPFQTYKKKLLCAEHKRHYASIQLRPEHFRDYLEREVGFAHSLSISEQQQYHGFQRPVLMCTKPTGRTPALPPAPAPPPLPASQPTASASAEASQQASVAMAAVSSAAETPESMRLAAASPLDQLNEAEDPFGEAASDEPNFDLDGPRAE